jgi:Ca2+-binding RTX toxin-like protein
MRAIRALVLIALVVLAVTAAPASAADVTYDGGGLTILGAPGESSRLTVTVEPNLRATVHDDAAGLRPGAGCLGTPSDVSCGALLGPQCHPCSARIELGDGNDTLALAGTSQKGPFLVDGGAGDDEIHIVGDANAIVTGGPGHDVLRADAVSELDGGDGPDDLQGDRAVASYAARSVGVSVTLDGAANDGAPGENDNVTTGSVVGGDGADVLTGNDAANELSGRGGDDVLAGAGGDDTLRGDGGADRIDAGAGDDRVEGSTDDTVTCGPGTDVALGLAVPGAYGDCEAVFATYEEPYLTVGDVRLSKRRPTVTLGWHEYPGPAGPPVSAAGIVEMRYRGLLIARGAFAGVARPVQQIVTLALTARGRALACRSARKVRLLVVGTGTSAALGVPSSRSAIRRIARLPRVGTCRRA